MLLRFMLAAEQLVIVRKFESASDLDSANLQNGFAAVAIVVAIAAD